MKYGLKRIVSMLALAAMLVPALSVISPARVYADEVDASYLSLGADLTEEEQATVLELLGIEADSLDQYDVVYTTNQEEHDYLDAYVAYERIGDRALSSVLIVNAEAGSGISVTTHNVTYCTTGMYENALATAGIDDVKVTVAGPYNVSGTAALVGAIKAYAELNDETISEDTIDAAVDEIVTTGELEESIEAEDENVEGLVAYLKEQVASGNAEDLDDTISDGAQKFNIELTPEQAAQLKALLEKLSSIDLNLDSLKNQAQSVYDKLSDMGLDLSNIHIDTEEAKGLLQQIIDFIKGLFS